MAGHRDGDRGKGMILVVEDDKALREGLAINLRLDGYSVLTAGDGEDGMRKAFDAKPDLIILDIMMPCWTGLDVLGELRGRGESAPVLILSALKGMASKVEGLRTGADDYMTKPFDLPELMARVEALLRRHGAREAGEAKLSFANVEIDRTTRLVEIGGRGVDLSAREFDLLCLLASAPGQVFTREQILQRLWGWDYEGTARTVDNFVASLRRKLKTGRRAPEYVKTVPKVGYKLDASPPD